MKRTRIYLHFRGCRRGLLVLLLLWSYCERPVSAQDEATALLNQLNSLMEQVQASGDPCPYMAKFKSLMNQFARQSPEMYQAMKPSLDTFNSQSDGCPSGADAKAASPVGDSGASPPAPVAPGSMASQFAGQAGVTHTCKDMPGGLTATCMYYKGGVWLGSELACPTSGIITVGDGGPGHLHSQRQSACVPGTPVSQISAGTCPPSGFVPGVMAQNGDTAVGVPCTPGQPIGNTGTSTSKTGGTTNSGVPVNNIDPSTLQICREVTLIVRNTTTMIPDGPFSCPGHMSNKLTNNSVSTVTCTWAYLVNGQYVGQGTSSIASGQTIGGQMGGMDSCNASGMKYYCYDGKDPNDSHGVSCFQNIRWQ